MPRGRHDSLDENCQIRDWKKIEAQYLRGQPLLLGGKGLVLLEAENSWEERGGFFCCWSSSPLVEANTQFPLRAPPKKKLLPEGSLLGGFAKGNYRVRNKQAEAPHPIGGEAS